MTGTGPLAPYHRMPTGFGPMPGPRNVPGDARPPAGPSRQAVISFTAEVHPDALAAFLPARVAVRAPRLTVQLVTFENLPWFAGRGYHALSVSVPVRHTGPAATVDGNFLLVMWEDDADPILTGRDELGFPKLYADLDVTAAAEARELGVFGAQASWAGTRFFRAEGHDLVPAVPAGSAAPLITHRYVPAVGDLAAADADYLTIAAPGPAPSVTHSAVGSGTFAFESVAWRDVPLQYPAINALAGLEVRSFGPVRFVCSEGGGSPLNRRLD